MSIDELAYSRLADLLAASDDDSRPRRRDGPARPIRRTQRRRPAPPGTPTHPRRRRP